MISAHESYVYSDSNEYNRPAGPVNEVRPGTPTVDIILKNSYTQLI